MISPLTETLSPTVSIGIAQYTTDGQEAKELINAADTALYFSKHNGKNMVATFEKDGCKKAELETFEQAQQNNNSEMSF